MAGNTTNPYLTKKAQEKRRLSIPVVAVCTIFGLGAASAGIDLFREGKTLSGVMAVLLLAALFTAAAVIVFALVLSFARLSDGVIRAVNQVIKLVAIYLGVRAAVGTGTGRPLLRGMLVGLIYMAVGVMLYAVLTAQHLSAYAYAADILMGVAAGGLIAMLRARKR